MWRVFRGWRRGPGTRQGALREGGVESGRMTARGSESDQWAAGSSAMLVGRTMHQSRLWRIQCCRSCRSRRSVRRRRRCLRAHRCMRVFRGWRRGPGTRQGALREGGVESGRMTARGSESDQWAAGSSAVLVGRAVHRSRLRRIQCCRSSRSRRSVRRRRRCLRAHRRMR
jgi:hypothetical protein